LWRLRRLLTPPLARWNHDGERRTDAAHGLLVVVLPSSSWGSSAAVAEAARRCDRPVVLAAFGDHRPSLPATRCGTDTDYLIWRSDRPGTGARQDLNAAALHRAVRAALGIAPK